MFSAWISCLQATLAATNSAEQDESTTMVCFNEPHKRGDPFRKTTYPVTLCFVQEVAGNFNGLWENIPNPSDRRAFIVWIQDLSVSQAKAVPATVNSVDIGVTRTEVCETARRGNCHQQFKFALKSRA